MGLAFFNARRRAAVKVAQTPEQAKAPATEVPEKKPGESESVTPVVEKVEHVPVPVKRGRPKKGAR